MTAINDEIFATLKRLLQPFNTENVDLKPDTDISSELKIDSVAVMDFIMEVEDAYDIDIPLNVLSETRTVRDLAAVVEARMKKG